MMPHEHKILTFNFLNELFKNEMMVKEDVFPTDQNPDGLDIKNLKLGQFGDRNKLLLAHFNMYHFVKSPFYDLESMELVTPFFPEIFKIENYEEKLKKCFDRMKANPELRKNFKEVSVDLEYKDHMTEDLFVKAQAHTNVFDRYKFFDNTWLNKHKADLLLIEAHKNISQNCPKGELMFTNQFIISPKFKLKMDWVKYCFGLRTLRVDQHVCKLVHKGML